MIKEEKELREYHNFLCQTALIKNNEGSKLITALIRSVREDAVKQATIYFHGTYYQCASEDQLLRGIAAAIRRRK
ncbi:MAG: hypothetical protein WC763_07145 [Candidatus Paceibacterota bacterium]